MSAAGGRRGAAAAGLGRAGRVRGATLAGWLRERAGGAWSGWRGGAGGRAGRAEWAPWRTLPTRPSAAVARGRARRWEAPPLTDSRVPGC